MDAIPALTGWAEVWRSALWALAIRRDLPGLSFSHRLLKPLRHCLPILDVLHLPLRPLNVLGKGQAGSALGDQPFEISFIAENLLVASGSRVPSLNGRRALMTELLQALKDARPVHVAALAGRNLPPQMLGVRGIEPALDVDGPYIASDNIEGIDRIALEDGDGRNNSLIGSCRIRRLFRLSPISSPISSPGRQIHRCFKPDHGLDVLSYRTF